MLMSKGNINSRHSKNNTTYNYKFCTVFSTKHNKNICKRQKKEK